MPVQIYFETKEAANLLRSLRPKPDKQQLEREELRLAFQALKRPAAKAAVPAPSRSIAAPVAAPPTPPLPPVAPPPVAPQLIKRPKVAASELVEAATTNSTLVPALTQASLTVPIKEAFRKTRKSKADDIVDTIADFFSVAENVQLETQEPVVRGKTTPLAEPKLVEEPQAVLEFDSDAGSISLEPTPVVAMEQIGDLRLSIRTSEKQQHAGVRTETCAGFFRRVLSPRKVETVEEKESPVGDGLFVASSAPLALDSLTPPKNDVPRAEEIRSASPENNPADGFFRSANLDADAPVEFEPSSKTVVERGGKASVPAGMRTESTAGFFRRVVGGA